MYFYILDNDILYIKSTSTIYFLYIYILYILANDQNRMYRCVYARPRTTTTITKSSVLRKRKSFTSFLVFFFFFSVKYIYVAVLVYLSKLCVLYGVIYCRNPGRIKWKFFERMIILFSLLVFVFFPFHSMTKCILQIPLSSLFVFILVLMILF